MFVSLSFFLRDADLGGSRIYLSHYLDLGYNWKTFNETRLDFAQGLFFSSFGRASCER